MSGLAGGRARWFLRAAPALAPASTFASLGPCYTALAMLMRAPGSDQHFRLLESGCVPGLVLATLGAELAAAQKLAFLSVRPVPLASRWLLLGPLCALVLPLAIISGATGSLSPLAVFTTLGCGLWAITVARWAMSRFVRRAKTWAVFARNVFWGLALLPVAWAEPIASGASYRAAGWAAAAAVAMGMGLLGLALQPDAYLGWDPTPGRPPWARRPGATAPPRAERRRPTSRGWLATVAHLWRLDVHPLAVALGLVGYGITFLVPADGLGVYAALEAVILGLGLCAMSERAKTELLAARPFSRAQLLVARALPWLLLALVMPVTALVRLAQSSGHLSPEQLLGFALCSLTTVLALGTSTSEPFAQGAVRWPSVALAGAMGVTGMAYVMSVVLGSGAQVPLLAPLVLEAAIALALWWRHVVWMRRR
jgi:hypothetical protein